jgi:cell division protein FtsB
VVALSTTSFRRPRLELGFGPQVIGVVLVVVLAGAMAIQPTRQLLAQRGRIEQMESELRRTQRANERLEAYLTRLNDPDYIEQQARAQLGLVRPGETTFVVMPPKKRAKDTRGGNRRAAHGDPAEPNFLERLFAFIGLP